MFFIMRASIVCLVCWTFSGIASSYIDNPSDELNQDRSLHLADIEQQSEESPYEPWNTLSETAESESYLRISPSSLAGESRSDFDSEANDKLFDKKATNADLLEGTKSKYDNEMLFENIQSGSEDKVAVSEFAEEEINYSGREKKEENYDKHKIGDVDESAIDMESYIAQYLSASKSDSDAERQVMLEQLFENERVLSSKDTSDLFDNEYYIDEDSDILLNTDSSFREMDLDSRIYEKYNAIQLSDEFEIIDTADQFDIANFDDDSNHMKNTILTDGKQSGQSMVENTYSKSEQVRSRRSEMNNSDETDETELGRIVLGRDTVETFPYMVYLESFGRYCGGTLIDPYWVLTAAHCFSHRIGLRAFVGKRRLTERGGSVHHTDLLIKHPHFRFYNDIALVRLKSPATGTPLPLASNSSEDFARENCTILGWGHRVGYMWSRVNTLQRYDTKVMSHAACRAYWGLKYHTSHICIKGPGGACKGDSGGPLICDGQLVGVTSFGYKYCLSVRPSVFTRVSEFYDWIQETMEKYAPNKPSVINV